MKKLLLMLFTVLTITGCTISQEENERMYNRRYVTIVIDSCEYLCFDRWDFDLTHKGNCKYCIERRKKETTELIDSLFNMQE